MPHPWYLLDVEGGLLHQWEVIASVSGGSASVNIGDLHALLKGQKLVGSIKFDGTIECADEYEALIGGQDIVGLSDTLVSLAKFAPDPNISLADVLSDVLGGQDIAGLADSATLTFENQ